VSSDPESVALLSKLRRALFKYPMATQAAFSALAAEGRAFAETPEGARLRNRLGHAKATGRGRMLWEALSLGSFTERDEGPLPSAMVDALSSTLRRRHLEPLLAKLFANRG
jgi:hypothetical protein